MYLPRLLSLIVLIFLASPVCAWNAKIHMAVVELALEQVSAQQNRHFNDVAYDLVSDLTSDRRLYLMRNFEGTSWLAQLSVIADTDRDLPLEELFARHQLQVPELLQPFRNENTSSWHYVNTPVSSTGISSQCLLTAPVNITSVLPMLEDAYRSADTEKGRALILAFIVHLVADAHQPLHSFTRVDDECVHDRGGNTFCASRRSATQRCEENLHQLWDSALHLFDDEDRVADIRDQLSLVQPNQKEIEQLDVNAWVEESLESALFVYATTSNRRPDPSYFREGRALAAERLVVAAYRLAQILQNL